MVVPKFLPYTVAPDTAASLLIEAARTELHSISKVTCPLACSIRHLMMEQAYGY